jgi:hypothetical protein
MSVADPNEPKPFTHTAYLFIRMASRRGKVIGYWKNGGDFRQDAAEPFAFIDMVPRGGWDGRIRFVEYGAPPPEPRPPKLGPHASGSADEAGADGDEDFEE